MPQQNLLQIYDHAKHQINNTDLAQAILALPDEAFTRRSHFFHGRYENLYIDTDQLPGLNVILDTALHKAAAILNQTVEDLQLGFWLNIMYKGDVTSLHSHDDDDELLSAVYYVQAPTDAGLFRLHHNKQIKTLEAVTGRFMFFDPALPHEVIEHRCDIPRISIGMNIGPAGNEPD